MIRSAAAASPITPLQQRTEVASRRTGAYHRIPARPHYGRNGIAGTSNAGRPTRIGGDLVSGSASVAVAITTTEGDGGQLMSW